MSSKCMKILKGFCILSLLMNIKLHNQKTVLGDDFSNSRICFCLRLHNSAPAASRMNSSYMFGYSSSSFSGGLKSYT